MEVRLVASYVDMLWKCTKMINIWCRSLKIMAACGVTGKAGVKRARVSATVKTHRDMDLVHGGNVLQCVGVRLGTNSEFFRRYGLSRRAY